MKPGRLWPTQTLRFCLVLFALSFIDLGAKRGTFFPAMYGIHVTVPADELPLAFAALLPLQLQDTRFLPPGDGAEGDLGVVGGTPVELVNGFFAGLVRAQGTSDCMYYAYHLVSRIPIAMDALVESGLEVTRGNVLGVLVGLLTVLYKSIDDHHFLNAHLVLLFGRGVSLRQLNRIEARVFLLLVGCPNWQRLVFTL